MSACGSKKCDVNVSKTYQDLSCWEGKELTAKQLIDRLVSFNSEKIRMYTVQTTQLRHGEIVHYGTGPNLEGGVATLCTCMHGMRRNQSSKQWVGQWVVGLASAAKEKGFLGSGKHHLFYMMKVKNVFSTYLELIDFLKINNTKTLEIKNATTNVLGDIYIPKPNIKDGHDFHMYKRPHPKHDHGPDENGIGGSWHDDIEQGPYLIGDENNTFVWTKPMVLINTGWDRSNVGNCYELNEEFFELLIDTNVEGVNLNNHKE